MRYPTLLGLAASLVLSLPSAEAADLLGADLVLQRLAEVSENPAASEPSDGIATLKLALENYRREAASLPPETAAARWLALHDRLARVSPEEFLEQNYLSRIDTQSLIQSLPPPAAWDALAAAIRERTEASAAPSELALRILGAVLAGDRGAQTAAVERLRTALAKDKKLDPYSLQNLHSQLAEVSAAIETSAGDSAVLAAFDHKLREFEEPSGVLDYRGPWLEIPNLLRGADRETVAPLLLRALRLDVEFQLWQTGEPTRRLLAELTLRHIDEVKRPHWELVSGLDDVALYEALDKKFPSRRADGKRRAATVIYLFGLVSAGRTTEAAELVFDPATRFETSGLGYGADNVLVRLQAAGRGDAAVDFLRDVLTRDPALPLWETYIDLAARQSRAPETIELLREVISRPEIAAEERDSLRQHYADALLAADQLDEGLALLREMIAADAAETDAATPETADATAPAAPAEAIDADAPPGADAPPATVPRARPTSLFGLGNLVAMAGEVPTAVARSIAAEDEPLDDTADEELADDGDRLGRRAYLIKRLLDMGRLLERPELVDEGLAAGRRLLPRLGEDDGYARTALAETMAEVLEKRGLADQAETLWVGQLAKLLHDEDGAYRPHTQAALLQLAALYARAGRHADVLRLLTGAPELGAADLAELSVPDRRTPEPSAHLLVADALAATGRHDEARRILRRMVETAPGNDAAYERLEKLGGADQPAFLEKAATIDRFEERPLIWKARIQLAAGDLPGAEKTIRAAIAIDPSDGEQGKNDRMRAYAVLGDILEKRGDAEQAALMRGAVAAIRLSEQADDWWAAGLLTRAVRLYEQSLLKFADAYCIQSRLALRYNELGDFAKAEEHYRRAFELMPESFGRVESHCFGCEGAFNGPRAQTVAERVFTRLAAERPNQAQVFYLLGYLRSEQDRPDEAVKNFRQAVALDPDYLNAWSKLQGLADSVHLPAAEREAIALAILRLDPAGKRAQPDFDGVADLRRLWGAVLATEATLPQRETGPLFEFTAAKAKIEADGKDSDDFDPFMRSSWANRPVNLREHLSEAPLFSAIAQLMENARSR